MNDQVIETDFLIAGGGIQGITLLHQLVAAGARRVLLVSRDDLGVGETLHGHGYMHHGYTMPVANKQFAGELAECGAWWWRRIEAAGSSYRSQPPTYYGVSADAAVDRMAVWDDAGLGYESVEEPPAALRGGEADGASTRLFTIRDRTVSMRELVADLAAPLQDHVVRAELVSIELDGTGSRVAGCRCSRDGDEAGGFVVRPKALLLAAGRHVQPLLRRAQTPQGGRPLDQRCREFNNIRFVPMLLVRGQRLPQVTACLEGHAIWMLTHQVDDSETMWIVTYLRDHEIDRGNFDESRESMCSDAVHESLDRLCALVPEARERLRDDLRFSFYLGGKTDNPAGGNGRHIDDGGVANMRVVWPGLWSLALANARDIVAEFQADACWAGVFNGDAGSLHAQELGLTSGSPVGQERRLTGVQAWLPYDDFAVKMGIV